MTTAFFFVVVFNENWVLSTAVYLICITVLMKRIGIDLLGEESYELAIKAIYSTFIYGVIAYLSESRAKQAYIGSESSDKAFYKWLKIFETFPEGIALIRNNYILYTNRSLKNILEIHQDQYLTAGGNKNDLLKRQLMETKVIPYESSMAARKSGAAKNNSTNVWQFLARNEKGNTFELSVAPAFDDEKNPGPANKKFITLNQVNVNVTGSKDKLLIIRDVSHIIYLEQIMETKHQMSLFTDNLMKQIQGNAEFTSSNLQKLDRFVEHGGKQIAEESYDEINKLLYRIKDFEQVYNISEQKFRVKDEDYSVKKCLDEVIQIAQHELQKKSIDLSVSNANDLPSIARGDSFKFKQITLNLLLQSIAGTIKGAVRIKTEILHDQAQPMVCVEIDNQKKEVMKKDGMKMAKLMQMTEFKKILESKTDINLKIAKILTNALNWKIDFNSTRGCKFTFVFPLKSDPQSYKDQEIKSPTPIEMTHGQQNYGVSTNKISARALEDEIEELEDLPKNQTQDQMQAMPKTQETPPMFVKSTCCGQALLLSLKEMVNLLED